MPRTIQYRCERCTQVSPAISYRIFEDEYWCDNCWDEKWDEEQRELRKQREAPSETLP